MVGAILWALIGGTIIGFLGKWVAPGDRDHIPLWLTIVCGIGGVLIGNFIYGSIWDSNTNGFDWWRHTWQVVVAAVLVSAAAGFRARPRARV